MDHPGDLPSQLTGEGLALLGGSAGVSESSPGSWAPRTMTGRVAFGEEVPWSYFLIPRVGVGVGWGLGWEVTSSEPVLQAWEERGMGEADRLSQQGEAPLSWMVLREVRTSGKPQGAGALSMLGQGWEGEGGSRDGREA